MKKTIKRIALVLVATPFILFAIGAIIYFTYALLAIGGESTQHQAYLKNNMEEVHIGGEENFKLFDDAFYKSKVIMLGEIHGFAKPQELDLELLKHLNKKSGLTHYLAEVDYSQAYFLNEYLRTGDEALLTYVFQTWVDHNAQWGNKEFYSKLQKIYQYNQAQPTDKKIQIVGVDKIQDIGVTKRHLEHLLRGVNYKAGSDSKVDALTQLLSDSTSQTKDLQVFAADYLTTRIADTLNFPSAIQADMEHVFANLRYQYESANRDSVMFLNLVNLTKGNDWEDEQFYGMWGVMHTLQHKVNNGYTSFAAHLKNKESVFKDKVLSINIMATDSENMIPAGTMPAALSKGQAYVNSTWVNSDGPLVFVNGIKDLKSVTEENTVAIFKVDSEASPYRNSSLLANTAVLIPGQGIEADASNPTITQACQYVVLIRNSKATSPIKTLL